MNILGSRKKQKQNHWDDESYDTYNLYGSPKSTEATTEEKVEHSLMTNIKEAEVESKGTNTANSNMEKDGFVVVGQNGKVRWEFLITAHTTDKEIDKTATPILLKAVALVEKQLGMQVQPEVISVGPKAQAKQARGALKNQRKRGEETTCPNKMPLIIRHFALEDLLVKQNSGVKVTPDEKN